MATTVQANFNSTDYSTQLVPMCQALFNAEVKITFWGNRVVELSGGQGSISIDELANRMLIAGSKRCSDDDLTLAERLAGVEIVHTLETFYSNSDNLVSQCNFLTRIFLFFREFKMPFTSFGIRFELHCDGEAN